MTRKVRKQACRSQSFSGPGTGQSLGAETGFVKSTPAGAVAPYKDFLRLFLGCHFRSPKQTLLEWQGRSGDEKEPNREDKMVHALESGSFATFLVMFLTVFKRKQA